MKFSLGLSFLSAVALLACSDATGSLVGGDQLMLGGGSSSGGGSGSSGGGDGGLTYISSLSTACQPGGTNGGERWQDLYLCYFGPMGVASCSVTPGGCHGTASDPGAIFSGYTCGADSTACLTSMKGALIPAGKAAAQTGLYDALRKVTANGTTNNMPVTPPSLTFQDGDMSRIVAWITAGAPND